MKDVFGDEIPEVDSTVGRSMVIAAVTGGLCGVFVSALLAMIGGVADFGLLLGIVVGCALWFSTAVALILFAARIRRATVRVVAQSAITGVAFAPSVVVGHGVAPAPAWLVVFVPGHVVIALVPMVLLAVATSFVFHAAAQQRST